MSGAFVMLANPVSDRLTMPFIKILQFLIGDKSDTLYTKVIFLEDVILLFNGVTRCMIGPLWSTINV